MRQSFLITLFIAFFVVLPAHARLGETEDQCIARYGKPIEIDDAGQNGADYRSLFFVKGDYKVDVCILNGHCAYLEIKKLDKSELSDIEIQTLLEANADGKKWQRSTGSSNDQLWQREDGAVADYKISKHLLAFLTQDFLAAEQSRLKAADTQKLNGF